MGTGNTCFCLGGSGIAGLAGCALSQVGNVGPDLGQGYIVDSFMVVVFGGVGNLWGTMIGGMSLGIINKLLEPYAGAVLGALIAGPRHAGAGALIGAGSGAIAGAVSDTSREQYAQQMEEAYANGDQALDAQYEAKARDFRRAMSACLEGRGYKVQ